MLRSARWTAFVALTFLCVWAIWAFDTATLHVAPGLLDDGAHIVRALRYTQEGFFTTVLSSLAGVLDPRTAAASTRCTTRPSACSPKHSGWTSACGTCRSFCSAR